MCTLTVAFVSPGHRFRLPTTDPGARRIGVWHQKDPTEACLSCLHACGLAKKNVHQIVPLWTNALLVQVDTDAVVPLMFFTVLA